MSQLVCPLCGRFVGLEHFDPSLFEGDIHAVEVQGPVRGCGFEVVRRYSVLEYPAIMGLIADLYRRILYLMSDKGYLPPPGD